MKEIIVRQPDDWHAHLRIGDLMKSVINLFDIYGRVVCMGNLTESVDNLRKTIAYRNSIVSLATFLPIVGVMLTKNSTIKEWIKITDLLYDRVFIKYMPEGITTNSESGVAWTELENYYRIFELAQRQRIPILLHAEVDRDPETNWTIDEIDREEAAIPFVAKLARDFPDAIINVEHVSTSAMVSLIWAHQNLSGSISVNHLCHHYEDVFDDQNQLKNVHKYFKPVAKKIADWEMLKTVALSGSPKFFFGSDSAPHFQKDKEQFNRAGAFNALTNLSWLYEFFENNGAPERYEPFVSVFGARRYGFPLNKSVIKLRQQDWQVPQVYNGIVPDLAGRTMKWEVAGLKTN